MPFIVELSSVSSPSVWVVLSWGWFCFLRYQGTLNSLEILCVCQSRRGLLPVVLSLAEAIDTTEPHHFMVHGAAPMSKNYVAQTNGSGKMESLPVLLYIMNRFLHCTVWREIVGMVWIVSYLINVTLWSIDSVTDSVCLVFDILV